MKIQKQQKNKFTIFEFIDFGEGKENKFQLSSSPVLLSLKLYDTEKKPQNDLVPAFSQQ